MSLAGKVTAALAILAVFSAVSITLTAISYAQGVRTARGVQLELSNLELRDEGNPQVLMAFHIKNGSGTNIGLEACHLDLYLNGHFIGRKYAALSKTILGGFEETTIDFVIPISAHYLPFVELARQKEGFSWFVRGRAKLLLPFGEQEIWLYVREHWRE